ncbi:hypothetical protein EW026_g810 [Hermanssonia centrifuga]|uniref:Uncharacterized protein n=1 Tax=Hermanssonia centrifuga TaxID=98765 RepID=A0A4S4KTI2_9APHY|nr:hypothetical protein EW026_g810 [Hermanssonia centrifuga]
MQELQRKSKGVLAADAALCGYVRTVTFTLTKSDVKGTMPAITTLLSALPALHTIQILSCKIAGDFKNAVTYLSLPTVHTLIIPTDANALVRACPNVKHVRCAGGHGSALVGSLKGSKCETLDGMIDWVKDRKLTEHGDEVPSDRASIDAARDVLRNSELGGEKKLIIRRIEAPHYENNPPHDPDKDLDLLLSESTEIFTSE